MRWPDGFMWGSGASSTQCEGAAQASDWWAWERAGHAPLSGDGNGFGVRYGEDFRLLADLGLRHHRLSIEWSRVEPEPGRHDPAAIAHYRDVLAAALDAGVEPWLCLHHFTLPRWFADTGGFLTESNRLNAWVRHVEFIAETFGDLARGWQPVNETNYYAFAAYLGPRLAARPQRPRRVRAGVPGHAARDGRCRRPAQADRGTGRVDLRPVRHPDHGRDAGNQTAGRPAQ
jgi:beta-glucosidase